MIRRRSRLVAAAAAVAMVLASTTLPSAASAARPAPAAAPAQDAGAWLTLGTGDRVQVRPGAKPGRDLVIRPASGRERVRFTRVHRQGRVLLLPADQATAVWSGRSDPAAFDITALLGTPAPAAAVTPPAVADLVPLTIKVLDHDGRPTSAWMSTLDDVAREGSFAPYDASGTAVVQVPRGAYFLNAQIDTARPGGSLRTLISEPALVVDGPTTVTLDARDGRQTGMTVDNPTAVPGEIAVIFERTTDDGRTLGYSAHARDFTGLLVRPSRTTAVPGAFSYSVAGRLARPDGSGGFAGSPYLYHLQWIEPDRVPAVPIRHIPDDNLAVIRAELASTGPGRVGRKDYLVSGTLPFSITELYIPDTPWLSAIEEFGGPVTGEPESTIYSGERFFAPRATGVERWNVGVFGPSFPRPWPWSWTRAVRTGDTIDVELPLHTDQGLRREGRSATAWAATELYRNGRRIGTSSEAGTGAFQVPAGDAEYRLVARATRSSVAVSTDVTVQWRFRSRRTGDTPVRLPLAAVRFTPALDLHNRAPAKRWFDVPVQVQWQDGATHERLRFLWVEASFDGGRRWQPVRLTGSGEQRIASIRHPAGAEHVSLRATAVDAAGNRVEQTVLRAYLLDR
ncbi:hypothetical protein ABZ570_16760 [Micromonospora sp. NPDC007271]|uniref:hypothetical protein n=1 Tax=Micromonospora sp. NPDC007271 TaxID=3154587 RepID=UPI0033F9BBE5